MKKSVVKRCMSGMSGDSKSRMPGGASRPVAERASSTGNTLWDDVRELLDVWDQKTLRCEKTCGCDCSGSSPRASPRGGGE